jgi:hypothetical protein
MTTTRALLPQRRRCETFDMRHAGLRAAFTISVGYYEDGGVGEVFITGAKAGSTAEVIARDGAVLLSFAVQYGVPLDVIRGALTREANGAPSTIVGAVVDRLAAERIPRNGFPSPHRTPQTPAPPDA